jgi:hypothetical protein
MIDMWKDVERDFGMDWEQVRLNGGPPCHESMGDGTLCGRAQRWFGHPSDHKYMSLRQFAAKVLREEALPRIANIMDSQAVEFRAKEIEDGR